MAWDDSIPEEQYEAAMNSMDAAFKADVEQRAAAAGVEVDQFDSLAECDLYLQSIGK